jgi:aryl-alcohol dehydrogenase-like predicted oxidoreductase
MPTRPLGTSGLEITTIGLGTWAIGGGGWSDGWGPQDDGQSLAAMRHAVELGMNWFDTAGVYGHGHSEEVVGRFLKEVAGADRPFIFTKCGPTWDEHDPYRAAPSDLSPANVRRQTEDSLRRLGVDHLDLLQFHWPDETGVPIDESWAELVRLVDEGTVRAVGVSNFDTGLLARCEAIRHVDSLQQEFSLVERRVAAKELTWVREHGTGLLCYSPIGSGQLTDGFTKKRVQQMPTSDWRRREFKEPYLSRNLALRDALRPIAAQHDTTVMSVALAWLLAWDGVTAAIVGARRPEQIDGWTAAASLTLTRDDLDQIARFVDETNAGEGPTRP